ncbi:MAG: PRC-barrel domain-containing protein [Bryobacteraceae bacterium]
MIRSIKELTGYSIRATDGDIGAASDFYFDDLEWKLRYLVVNTEDWLPGREVLISPVAVGQPNWGVRMIPVNLTRRQVETSPDVGTDRPVSRVQEEQMTGYYGWPVYWDIGAIYAPPPMDYTPEYVPPVEGARPERERPVDPHLRSARDLMGYYIEAAGGDIGHVDDLLLDDESWAVRFLVIDTSNWWIGKKVLIAPDWAQRISWEDRRVYVSLEKEQIRGAPEFDPSQPVDREYERRLYEYYGRRSWHA